MEETQALDFTFISEEDEVPVDQVCCSQTGYSSAHVRDMYAVQTHLCHQVAGELALSFPVADKIPLFLGESCSPALHACQSRGKHSMSDSV